MDAWWHPTDCVKQKDFAVAYAMYACGAHSSRREHIRRGESRGMTCQYDKGQWWEAGASGKKGCERMPAGAPRKWKSVKAMQAAIDAYFKACEGEPFIGDDGCVVRDKYGIPIIINAKPPTITGLALALGFTGRQALIDYQARPEFADTVTRAKARCEEYAEARLYDRDGANGAKFSLSCNFGWREKAPETDRQEIGVVLMPEVKTDA